MAEDVRVYVRVDKYLDGDAIRLGVPVRFRPIVVDTDGRAARRTDRSREIITVIAPVSSREDYAARAYLAPGEYEVEAVLPSGEQLSEELTVGPTTAENEDEVTRIVLRGEPSPNEWRSWGHYAGTALAPARSVDLNLYKTALRHSAQLEVTVGSQARVQGLYNFDPSSWTDWFHYLQQRFLLGPKYALNIQLDGNESSLRVETQGGYDDAPLRIKFVLDDHRAWRSDRRLIGVKRTYAAISGVSGTRLVALPWPWGERLYYDGASPFELLAAEDRNRLRCEPVLKDERWAGLVAYLNRGRVDLAGEILNSARDALFEKFQNPLAAAVGGYVLLSSDRRKRGESWPSWLDNLSRRFPHLPDGPILRARWLLAQNAEKNLKEAHDLLVESFHRGLPYFTTGVVWLIEGLEQTSIGCESCVNILRLVRGVARSMDLSQAFTSFSIAKPQTRSSEQTNPEFSAPPGVALEEPEASEVLRRIEEGRTQVAVRQPQNVWLNQR